MTAKDRKSPSMHDEGRAADAARCIEHCTVHPYADSVVYAIDILQGGKVVRESAGGWWCRRRESLRDEYDATSGTALYPSPPRYTRQP